MRVLVTGGAGFIGSHIVDLLIQRGHDVAVLDDLSSGRRENVNPRANLIRGDIAEAGRVVRTFQPNAICHQAAQPSLLRSVQEPIFDATTNILGTLAVIDAARAVGAYVVMASTSAVYAEDAAQPYAEDAPKRPTRPYGIAKLAAEMYLRESWVMATILRYGNVYGPRQVPVGENQLVPHALNHILHGAPFLVNGDGEQTRDFVYVGDVAKANVSAIEKRFTGTYNIAQGVPHSVNEVLGHLAELTGWRGQWRHGPAKPREPWAVSLDIRRAQVRFGWFAETPLAVGLGSVLSGVHPNGARREAEKVLA
jgi:UDP-glucose 4-epimerase